MRKREIDRYRRSPLNKAALEFVQRTPGWSTKPGGNHHVMIVAPDGRKMPLHPTPEGGGRGMCSGKRGLCRITKIYREFGLPV